MPDNQRPTVDASRPPRPAVVPPEIMPKILAAPGLRFDARGKQHLRRAVERAAREYRLRRHLDATRLRPGSDARRLRGVASRLDAALDGLVDKAGLPDGQLMAWAGDEADRTHPRSAKGPSGFERAARAVDQIAWLRDLVQSAAQRLRDEPGDPPGRSTYSRAAKLDAIRRLAPAYENAFGRRMGVTRGGPAVRFLQAFFKASGERPGPAALADLISKARRRE